MLSVSKDESRWGSVGRRMDRTREHTTRQTRSTPKVRLLDFGGGCGPRFEPARLLAADAPGAKRIKMAHGHLSSSLLRAPGLTGLVAPGRTREGQRDYQS